MSEKKYIEGIKNRFKILRNNPKYAKFMKLPQRGIIQRRTNN